MKKLLFLASLISMGIWVSNINGSSNLKDVRNDNSSSLDPLGPGMVEYGYSKSYKENYLESKINWKDVNHLLFPAGDLALAHACGIPSYKYAEKLLRAGADSDLIPDLVTESYNDNFKFLLNSYRPFKATKVDRDNLLNTLFGQLVFKAYDDYINKNEPEMLIVALGLDPKNTTPKRVVARVKSFFKPEHLTRIKKDLANKIKASERVKANESGARQNLV